MTQNGSFFSHIPPTLQQQRHLSLLSEKNNTSRLQKHIRLTLGFSSDQSVYQTGIYQPALGHCVASNPLPPAPG